MAAALSPALSSSLIVSGMGTMVMSATSSSSSNALRSALADGHVASALPVMGSDLERHRIIPEQRRVALCFVGRSAELKKKNGGQYHQQLTKKRGGGVLVASVKAGDISGTEDPNGSGKGDGGNGTPNSSADEDKSLEIMRKFSEQYAKRTGTYFCVDKSVTAVVIKGLAEHKDQLGAPLCPCRHYDDKMAEATQGFWNCPCVPMRERKECHCMLFLTEDADFVGTDQNISKEEIKDLVAPF
eukprot:TRINITY_DN598_c0_g1_i6.p1 TRINITY_DN598_c0_g1~~TRINITY_DN598_c0_g1_i6.p1  ORF type:complete len:242 (-),score=45.86 TRINITY_DN598_c0_g1_i6:890-1615(-)